MSKSALQLFFITVILVLAQVIVFKNICLFGIAVPFAFIYSLLRLPVTLSREWLYTIGFALGLTVDIFTDTCGMNAFACTVSAALRRPVLRLYFPRDDELTDPYPCISSLGLVTYAKYALSMSLVYCALIFIIEAFSFFNILRLILEIAGSTILTTMFLIGIDSLTIRHREKRL